MILQRSRFLHSLPVGAKRYLLIHAVTHARLTIDQKLNTVVDFFAVSRLWPDDYSILSATVSYDRETLSNCIADLIERGFITDKSADEELAETTSKLSTTYGRDPDELLDRYRRELKEGAVAYWSAGAARSIGDLGTTHKRVDLLLFGDCDVHIRVRFSAPPRGDARDQLADRGDVSRRRALCLRTQARCDHHRRPCARAPRHLGRRIHPAII